MERSQKTVTLPPLQDLFSVQSVSSDFLPRISAYFLCERLFQGQRVYDRGHYPTFTHLGASRGFQRLVLGDPSPSLG